MIFRNIAQGLKTTQSCLAQMVSFALSDGRRWGIDADRLDEIRSSLKPARRFLDHAGGAERFATLPRVNLMRSIRCPHARAVAVLTQILLRLERIVAGLANDASLWDMVNIEAAVREVYNELKGALEKCKSQPAESNAVASAMHTPAPAAGITFRYIAEHYIVYVDGRVRAGRFHKEHFNNVRKDVLSFADETGDRLFDDLRQTDFDAWFIAHPSWKSIQTKKRVAASILACCNWAVRQALINRHPFRLPEDLRGQPYVGRRSAEIWEYVALMSGRVPRALRRALLFLRRTGCRTSEMRELRWRHLSLDGPTPHARLERHKTWGKTGKPRIIGIDPNTARFLRNIHRRELAARRGLPDDHVFTNCDGNPWDRSTFNKRLTCWGDKLGLQKIDGSRFTGYTLRHLYTVQAIEGGVPIRSIADQLGHAKTSMIDQVYGVHTRQHEQHLSDTAADIFRNRKRKSKPKETEGGQS
jgi:integrase